MKARGWPIRFRLHALSPFAGWEDDVRTVVAAINAIGPEMLTLGSLRASNAKTLQAAAERNGRDASIFDALRDRDPSGFKYRINPDAQAAMFSEVRSHLDPAIRLALCKEDASVWERLGMTFDSCHCLAGPDDETVAARSTDGLELVALGRASRPAVE